MTQKSSQYQKILAAIVSTVNYNTAMKRPWPPPFFGLSSVQGCYAVYASHGQILATHAAVPLACASPHGRQRKQPIRMLPTTAIARVTS